MTSTADLLKRYECGPLRFDDEDYYDRHVVFDHVMPLEQASAARPVRGHGALGPRHPVPALAPDAAVLRPQEPQGGLLPVDGVPDRPDHGQHHHQPADRRLRAKAILPRIWGRTGTPCTKPSPTRAWATAAWAGWPPASSTRWPRSRSRRSATACATSTACSARRSRTAARSSIPTTGCLHPDPWEVVRPDRDGRGPDQLRFPDEGGTDRPSSPTCPPCSSACPTIARSSATAARPSTRCGSGTLRLTKTSTFVEFSRGDFFDAVHEKVAAEVLTRVLYPDDSTPRGRNLRFVQEYFLVACSLADIIPGSGAAATTGTHFPTRSPSSSTTPTRPWPSPS